MDNVVLLVLGMLCLCSLLIAGGLALSYEKKWLFWSEASASLVPSPSPSPVPGTPPAAAAADGNTPAGVPPASSSSAWTDTFSAGALDTARWTVADADPAVNNEQQYYSPGNVSVDKDGLHLTAKREAKNNKPFTSGKVISTTGLKMGTVSVKCSLPKGAPGIWPAVWLLPRATVEGNKTPWPRGGEIDIMEWRGRTGAYASSLHWLWRGASGEPTPVRNENWLDPTACHSLDNPRDCHMTKSIWSAKDKSMKDTNVHTWAVTWDETRMEFSLDGAAYHTIAWADWFSGEKCDAAADPESWPVLSKEVNATKRWNACNPFTSGQEWLVIFNNAVGGVFDTEGTVQHVPAAADPGPWDFVIREVTVTPSA